MTIVFLQPDGVPITAQAERQGSAALYGAGSGRQLGGRSGLRVGTPSDTLTATSTVWTLKPCSAMIDPGAATHQGMYGWASDANITGSVTASDATYARKDIVYIQVNDSTSGDGSGATTAPVLYLAGTPSATPTAPTLPARSFLVGTIDVPKTGAGSPAVTLNPARFAAAGGILPVANQAARDAVTGHGGMPVFRTDTSEVEYFVGSAWRDGTRDHAPLVTSGWSTTGLITTTPEGSRRRVTVDLTFQRTGATQTDYVKNATWTVFATAIPTTARGTSPTKYLAVALLGGGNNIIINAALNPETGQVSIRAVSADHSLQSGALFSINATYYI